MGVYQFHNKRQAIRTCHAYHLLSSVIHTVFILRPNWLLYAFQTSETLPRGTEEELVVSGTISATLLCVTTV